MTFINIRIKTKNLLIFKLKILSTPFINNIYRLKFTNNKESIKFSPEVKCLNLFCITCNK